VNKTDLYEVCENNIRPEGTPQSSLMGVLDGRDRKRILVIDDDWAIRDIVSKILSHMGYDVTSASDGIEGFNLFVKSPFHLVVTDFDMPHLDGLELAKRIKERSANTLVILMTGQEKDDIVDVIEDSAIDLAMFKPFKLDDIEGAVQRIF